MRVNHRSLDRREFLNAVSAGAAGAAMSPALLFADEKQDDCKPSDNPSVRVDSYTYKTVGKLQIKANVIRPNDNARRPAVMWIHGGALIVGCRCDVTRQMRDAFLAAGCALVSIDYRLAPETKLPQIIEDVRDAYTWLHEQGEKLLNVDAGRIAVLGGSAGGYLTLMSGFCVKPRPAALVSFWGYGDLVGPWYSQPSEHYRKQPLVSKEDAWRGVSGPPTTGCNHETKSRMRFYLHCRQQGLWPKEVSGFDPVTDTKAFEPYCPVQNVTAEYPPTLLIHGTNDTDVPYEQSVMMDKELTKHGVEHEFITVPNAGHGIGDGDPKLVAAAYAAVVPFVGRFIKNK
jgi:acetyl esterase/lipase